MGCQKLVYLFDLCKDVGIFLYLEQISQHVKFSSEKCNHLYFVSNYLRKVYFLLVEDEEDWNSSSVDPLAPSKRRQMQIQVVLSCSRGLSKCCKGFRGNKSRKCSRDSLLTSNGFWSQSYIFSSHSSASKKKGSCLKCDLCSDSITKITAVILRNFTIDKCNV